MEIVDVLGYIQSLIVLHYRNSIHIDPKILVLTKFGPSECKLRTKLMKQRNIVIEKSLESINASGWTYRLSRLSIY